MKGKNCLGFLIMSKAICLINYIYGLCVELQTVLLLSTFSQVPYDGIWKLLECDNPSGE